MHTQNTISGENLLDTYIQARGETKCLAINTALFHIQGKASVLQNARTVRNTMMPSKQKIYRCFKEGLAWQQFKRQCVLDALQHKTRNLVHVSANDVPFTIRNEPKLN